MPPPNPFVLLKCLAAYCDHGWIRVMPICRLIKDPECMICRPNALRVKKLPPPFPQFTAITQEMLYRRFRRHLQEHQGRRTIDTEIVRVNGSKHHRRNFHALELREHPLNNFVLPAFYGLDISTTLRLVKRNLNTAPINR